MLLLWMLARIRIINGAQKKWLRRLHAILIIAPALAVAWPLTRDLYDTLRNKPYEPWAVAQQLHPMGITPGIDVGYIGHRIETYLPHLAGVRIIADVPRLEPTRSVAAHAAAQSNILAP